MNSKITGVFAAIIASLGAATSDTAQSQQTAEADAIALEEITVTARRREESLMETPVSVTAFGAQDLGDRQIFQANQIAEATPNLVYRTHSESSNVGAIVFIRGVGQWDFAPSVQPGVGIYVDEGYTAAAIGSLSEILDIESIEVLRGPQGTLFGRNTIGGAILINSKKPDENFAGEVEVLVGENDWRQMRGMVNIPLSDTFFAKISGLYREKDGWVDTPNIPNDDGLGSEDTRAGRIALRWLASDDITVDLYGDVVKRKSDGMPRVPLEYFENNGVISDWNNVAVPTLNAVAGLNLGPITNDLYAVPDDKYHVLSGDYFRAETDVYSVGLTVEWDINDSITLKSITNYREVEAFNGFDTDYSPEVAFFRTDFIDSEQWTQEFKLSGNALDGRLDWTLGAYYFEEETSNPNPIAFPLFGIVSGAKVENESKALFGQFTYDITDKLSVTLGGRYTKEKLDSIVDDSNQYIIEGFDPTCLDPSCTFLPPFLTTPEDRVARRGTPGYAPIPAGVALIQPNRVFDKDNSEAEPYINFSYEWSEGLTTYVSYAEGFKGGGFTQRVIPGNTVETFEPEKAKVYELGVKLQSDDNRFRLTGAVFYTDYEDLQVPVGKSIGSGLENASDAVLKGFELEAVGAVTANLTLSAGAGYLDAEYKDTDEDALFDEGNDLPNTPKWQINASAVYTIPVGDGDVRARLDYFYTSGFYTGAENFIETPSYEVFNGSLVYTPGSGDWEIALQARNLFDKFYALDRGGNANNDAVFTQIPGQPREIALRVKYLFD